MRGARSFGVLATLLWALWSSGTMAAEEPPKARSGAEGRYVVSVVLRGGDDLGVISRQLAGTYRARLKQDAEAAPSSFTVTASATSAEQMRSDPRVVRIEAAPPVMSDAGPSKVSSQAVAGFGTYAYDGAGNITAAGGESYVYDRFGRLKSAALPGGKTQSYTYDRWGNLRTVTTSGSSVVSKFGVDESTNRIDQPFDSEGKPNNVFAEYDPSGNLTKYLPTGEEFVYDGLNVLKQSKMGGVVRQYVYNASNERIAVINATQGGSEWTLRDTTGRVLRRLTKEWDGSWQWAEDYVYHGSRLLAAEVPGPEKVRHFHLDHLGTPRLITGNGGAKLAANSYYPFGMELPATNAVADGLKFTGHERDTPTLDYMHARYFNPFLGRFLSVDPEWAEDTPGNPQKWNRYAYVTNNPIRYTDPDGRDRCDTANGFFNSLLSNFGLTVRVEQDNADYQRGQRGGDQASVAAGGILTVASIGGAGTITIGTAGAGAVTIPGAVAVAAIGSMGVLNGSQHLSQSTGNRGSEAPKYKESKPGVSGKEAAKDAPSWAKGNRPKVGENGKDFATRLMNDKYGKGNWENKRGPGSEFNQIKKWGDRGFQDPR